jgi:cell division protein FtsW (lipid II flippase)
MINRKITILGPEGTNLYILLQFMIFSVISWFTLFSSIESIEFETSNILTRQIVFSLVGLIVFFLTTYLSIENLYNLINSLFLLSISVLVGLLFTTPILGVRRWYDLEPVGLPIFIQPSEFSKIVLVLFIAKILSQNSNKLIAISGVLINLFLIFIQPDFGTTMLLLIVTSLMFFVSDIKLRIAVSGLLVFFLSFFILLEFNLLGDYQISRITDFFTGEDFSQRQSRLSISSGGLFGTYFSESQISEVFVPVQTTDFIFSLFSRNFGFFGGLLLVSLWIVFFFRVNRIIKRTEIEFEKYLLSGLLILLGAQIFINLFTILGFIPLTGIPFPLLSLGGSSIFSTAIIFGLINRVFIENNIVV